MTQIRQFFKSRFSPDRTKSIFQIKIWFDLDISKCWLDPAFKYLKTQLITIKS